MKDVKGQILVITMVLLLTLAVFIPFLIQMAQSESRWTVKEQKNTQAFHLAELAVERGYQQLILSTITWAAASAGTAVSGFNFDATYTDPSGGEYQIRFTTSSGSGVYVTGVGRDKGRKEIRAVKAQFVGNGDADNSIYSGGQVSVSGSGNVEWGPIMARSDIDTGGRKWPRFYSTGGINPYDTNPAPGNSNNLNYWAYYTSLPAFPSIDLNYYKNQAIALGAAPAECGGTYFKAGNITFQGCSAGGAGQAGTWYLTGNATFKAGASGNYIVGEVVALGNLEMNGNGGSFKALTVPIPPAAWKEYGEPTGVAWAHYLTMDAGAPASYAAAVASSYEAADTENITNILVNGLMYQGANYEATGCGNVGFYGVVFCQAKPTLGANMTVWYKSGVLLAGTSSVIQRIAWKDVSCSWTTAGNAVCP